MQPARRILEALERGELVTGALMTDQLWPEMVDYCKTAGLDYMIVDQEHGAFPDDRVATVCAVGRMADFAVILRPIDCAYSTIRRAIDLGPCGLLLPGVESTADLDSVQNAIHMPPRGQRRPGGQGNYWVSDFTYDSWKREVEDDFIVLPQIETLPGLDNVDAIAAHPITTSIAIGPYDLSASLGVCMQMDHPKSREAVARIRGAGEKVGKTMWRIGDGPALAAEGFRFICVGEPVAFMKRALTDAVHATKQAVAS